MTQAGFTLDLNRCTGCSACRLACEIANQVSPGVHWRSVTTFNEPRWSGATVLHWSLACNHCASPSCLAGCPAGAYSKDGATGAVVLDRAKCIGCRYCSWVCPYAAPQLDSRTGTMEKCTFCLDRQLLGEAPACASACPTGALGFARDLSPAGAAAPRPPGFPDTGTRPAIRVAARRRGTAPPELTAAATATPATTRESAALHRGLVAEWPLLVFTLAASALVAWLTAGLLGAALPPAPWFLGLGAAALAASTLHLGRPLRAWRAARGLRRSWVSREVVALAACCGLGGAVLLSGVAGGPAGWVAVGCGVAALLAMDAVYLVRTRASGTFPHSAMATLTWALLAAALSGHARVALLVAALKLALYVARAVRRRGVLSWPLTAVRLVVGLGVPLALWSHGATTSPLLLVCLAAGELADRAEFYAELEFLTPRRQAALDLALAVEAEEPKDGRSRA
jgi:Fe-S-cluster-containing dehydrogenase component/DMSO reductase anchor subunit